MTDKLATLAALAFLTPAQAVALPAALDAGARSTGLTREALADRALADRRVLDVLAAACRSAT